MTRAALTQALEALEAARPSVLDTLFEARKLYTATYKPHRLQAAQDDLDRVTAAIAACRAALAQPDGWQPIETAPKDGRWILITNGANLENCYWDGGMHRAYPWRNRGGNGWLAEWPTHWMPIPAGPCDARGAQPAPAEPSEVVTWTPAANGLPDTDITVLLSLDESHGEPTFAGYWDGQRWLDVGANPITGVLGWADMPRGLRTT